jgi:hypothetical protein
MNAKAAETIPHVIMMRAIQCAKYGPSMDRSEGYFIHILSGTLCRPGQSIVPAYESDMRAA